MPVPAIIAGRGDMVRLRSGWFDWTVQVGYLPPLTESGARRRAQEKAIRMTLEFHQTHVAEAKHRSTPILSPDLKSGLGLKGTTEQIEEPFVGEHHRGEQMLAGHEIKRDCRHCVASWFLNKQRAQDRWESSGRHTGTWETSGS